MWIIKLIDTALLKILFIILRLLQAITNIFTLSAIAQFTTDVTNANSTITDTYVTVLAIACTAAVWSLFTSLIACCGGTLFFNIDIVLDFLLGVCFIVSAILLRNDGRDRCGWFVLKYFASGGVVDNSNVGRYFSDCRLIEAVYAFCIINIFLFGITIFLSVLLIALKQHRHHHKHEYEGSSSCNCTGEGHVESCRHHHHHTHHHAHSDNCEC